MTRQRSVATRTGVKRAKQQEIIKLLKDYPEGLTPKLIAFHTRLNVNTVKSLLYKMEGITNPLRGIYKVVERGDGGGTFPVEPLHSWNFHNCVLSSLLPKGNYKPVKITFRCPINTSVVEISPVGKCTFRVSSKFPINVPSLSLVTGLFTREVQHQTGLLLSPKNITIQTIEFNKDYSNLRLDGLKCITIDSLMEQFKIYQKDIGLRVEHKTKLKFQVSDIVDLLKNNPEGLETNVKLNQQSAILQRLTDVTARNTELIMKLLEGMKR